MVNLCQVVWTVIGTVIVAVGPIPALEDNNFRFVSPEKDQFPSTNFVPEKLKISSAVYEHLLVHLNEALTEENINSAVGDYFPKRKPTFSIFSHFFSNLTYNTNIILFW